MRVLTNDQATWLNGSASAVCYCLRLTRHDGVEIGFTDHDGDVVFGGTRFHAHRGMTLTALEESLGLAPDNADFSSILSSDAVGADDLERGVYDDATLDIWKVNWENPEQRILLKTGMLGEVQRSGGGFTAEFRGLTHRLDQETGRVYGRTCDTTLGSGRCGVNLTDAAYRHLGQVEAVNGTAIDIRLNTEVLSGYFRQGLIHLGGSKPDITIKDHQQTSLIASLTVWGALPTDMAVGTDVTLVAGCDKTITTCQTRFNNVINFQGFPTIPGNDVLTIYPVRGDG